MSYESLGPTSQQTAQPNQAPLFCEERRAAILALLEKNSSIKVTDIAHLMNVSTVTARNDLDTLAKIGKLRRTRGGAVSLHNAISVSAQDKRMNINIEAKKAIGNFASSLISDNETLLVDSGTTALEFIHHLDHKKNITIITNDLTIANTIDESMPNLRVVLLGGTLRAGHRYTFGPLTLQSLKMLHADTTILTPESYIPNRGFMTTYEQMAELKTSFLTASSRSIILLDSQKINKPALLKFASLNEADEIVMDYDPDNIMQEQIMQTNCSTHLHLASGQ